MLRTLSEHIYSMSGLRKPYKGNRHWFLLVSLTVISAAAAEYKGLYTTSLSHVHETIPQRVTIKGEHLSQDVTTYVNDPSEYVHFNLTIDNDVYFLALQPSRNFFTKSMIIEKRGKHKHERVDARPQIKNCHYHGVIHGQQNSKVAISACNGLTGIIYSQKGKYYIEPAYHPLKKVQPGHNHLIYKRSAVITNQLKKRKKKRKKQTNCGTRVPKKWTLLEWQSQQGKLKVQRKKSKLRNVIKIPTIEKNNMKKLKYKQNKKTGRNQRSVSLNHFVETLVVADASMVDFHQDGDIETYILTLMNMVSMLYQDPTLGNSVKIVVVKIILIEDPLSEPILNVTTNADTTLKTFCKWQLGLNPGQDSHPHHHDVAVLITRKDICARQEAPCGTLGVAHIGGMCKASRSCSVNEDNGITSAHTIAHELGHNFGMIHDTEKTGCKRREGNTIHIMTPNFEPDTVTVNWSNCSRREITRFLDKGLGQCLRDVPEEVDRYKYPDLPAGVMYDANYQCRLQFGKKATLCTPLDEICLHIWCSVNNTCTTLLRPAAEGTYCGKHKWCQNRECVLMLEPPTAIDGGWGEWSSWSDCSKTCGAGVSVKERECNHPTPAFGGKYCVGERKRYRICNTQACPAGEPTFRAAQCSEFDDQLYEGKKYKWQPYFDEGEPCQLYCSDANETVIVPWGDYAKDGTPCSVVSRDVCIAGICKKVGCDWVVDSKTEEDDCGICQGDGSKCDKKQGVYDKQNWSPGYREIVVIPKGARNIRIEEKDHSPNYISIGSALARRFYLNGARHIFLPGEYTVAGTQALYGRDNQLEKIRIPGPIMEPIVVYIYYRGNTFNPGVEYKYSIWKQEKTKEVNYIWILGEWSQCSVTCGGGTQQKQPLCQESVITGMTNESERPTLVEDYYCEPKDKPDLQMRACNEDNCPSKWWFGPWQACTATCIGKGKKPIKRRSVVCVDDKETALPDKFCDKRSKPYEYKPCTSLPPCEDL
ncbi:A disintegrin and metalloproteinase with thrombospondin motifs 7 isoform X1 [Diorhabda sublineata]|uniref:A disintegrin and metalloproteinase with thrombospondin motifs 7 isoform X1 n=2 Tax=Diorhabda sublineata TaxID=1163346 RepID=UPI0024E097A7|nr:A disintegrin and metalloproteinase with thrombospondin motifs 7 isoform X1 [Diorhabda sublineata]